MPTPGENETQQEWMKRCVPMMMDEGMENDQAVAACMQMWKDKDKDKDRRPRIEYKDLTGYVKAIEDRAVTGIAAVFGNIDSYSDRIFKGAFKKTIKEGLGKVRHLWMHDPWQPPTAVIKTLREVGMDELPDEVKTKFPDATGGLEVVREYLRTPRGDEILEGVKSGALNQMSFGYDPVKYDFEELTGDEKSHMTVRNLREIRLWDISDVNWGANQATVASKAFPFLEAYKDRLPGEQYDLLSSLADLTDRVLQPAQLKEGRVLSSVNLKKLKDALSVLSDILLTAEPPVDDESAKALTEMVLLQLQLYEHDPILLSVR
jgi:HK97 family phage prohead protease